MYAAPPIVFKSLISNFVNIMGHNEDMHVAFLMNVQ